MSRTFTEYAGLQNIAENDWCQKSLFSCDKILNLACTVAIDCTVSITKCRNRTL
jgi:hypothetical protein